MLAQVWAFVRRSDRVSAARAAGARAPRPGRAPPRLGALGTLSRVVSDAAVSAMGADARRPRGTRPPRRRSCSRSSTTSTA